MSSLNEDNPLMEVQIKVFDFVDNGINERSKEGDIITVREAVGRLGDRERARYLWIRVQGLDSTDWLNKEDPLTEFDDPKNPGEIYSKHRFCIPLDHLASIRPDIDIVKVRDKTLDYQPDMVVDEDTGDGLVDTPIMNAKNLIYDKKIEDFI